jgi:hypothetical protein
MQEKEARLHLAVVVGYVRICLKAGAGQGPLSLREIDEHARAHLARPEFADVRDRAGSEIFEFIKDGLLNGAEEKIRLANSGDYSLFWSFADRALGRKETPVPIEPEMLA